MSILNPNVTACVWIVGRQCVHTVCTPKEVLNPAQVPWCWRGCSCLTSVTGWHSPLIFYGLSVKWAIGSKGREVVNHTVFSGRGFITTHSSQWPASLHKQRASCWKQAKYLAGDKNSIYLDTTHRSDAKKKKKNSAKCLLHFMSLIYRPTCLIYQYGNLKENMLFWCRWSNLIRASSVWFVLMISHIKICDFNTLKQEKKRAGEANQEGFLLSGNELAEGFGLFSFDSQVTNTTSMFYQRELAQKQQRSSAETRQTCGNSS